MPPVEPSVAAVQEGRSVNPDPVCQARWLEGLIDASEDAVIFVDGDWRIDYWSRRAEQLLGWPPNAVIGKGLGSVLGLTPEGGRQLRHSFDKHQQLLRQRVSLRRAGGSVIDLALSIRCLGGADTEVGATYLVSLRNDIASSVNHEFQKFFFAVDQSLVGAIIAAPNGVIEYVNVRAAEILGTSPLELVGARLPDYLKSEATGGSDRIGSTAQEPDWRGDCETTRHDGAHLHLYVVASGIRDVAGKLANRVLLFEDITARRSLEHAERELRESLAHSSRLAALGEMATTLAHELNQPLAAIANFNQGSLRRLESGRWDVEPIIQALQEVSSEVTRARDIIQNVRRFARHQRSAQVPVDLRALVEQLLPMIRMACNGRHASIDFFCLVENPVIIADETQVAQIILNLAKNALDAMDESPDATRILGIGIEHDLPGHDGVRTSISDRGCGVADEHLGNLGKPFFSLKPSGLGLGLSISRTLLEAHGSHLDVRRNPSGIGGMTFSFVLPQIRTDEEPLD